MKSARLLVLTVATAPLWGYSYYLTDDLTAVNPASWISVGSLAPGGAGLAAPDSAGGSLISRIPIPDGSAEAEVRATLHLASSGGTYTEFLQASPDARSGGSGSGSYLAFEMQNPQIDSSGRCGATFAVLQSSSGVVTLLASFQHSCRDGMTLRMAVHGGTLLVWPDQATSMEFAIAASGVGQPGLSMNSTPSGNGFAQVQLGTMDRAAPPAIDANQVGVSAFRSHVDVQWKPVADDPTGSGLAGYWVYRDGLYFLRTPSSWFRDEGVAAGQNHTYAIYAVDQHFNFSPAVSFTVATPVPKAGTAAPPPPVPHSDPRQGAIIASAGLRAQPRERRGFSPLQVTAGTPPADSGNGMDPRRTGVRAYGAYWGAAGEQIDTTSGNLNFSVPLIKAMSRGWSVTFALSYNSQMWRQDSGGTWLMGYDVGYGLGWTLMAGSITPIWINTSQIDHYLYTDATGAEYSLGVDSGNVWTSQDGTYVTYDANASCLHFNDGSFWVMGATSSGGEQDSGNLYPTLMEDSNGNELS